jgi:hypothetical protein
VIRSGHLIHLRRDAIKQSVAIVADVIHIEMGTPRQKGKLRMAAQTIERGLQTVRRSVQIKGVVGADEEVCLGDLLPRYPLHLKIADSPAFNGADE